MSAPNKKVAQWTTDDFMQFITSVGIKGDKYNKIKKAMEENSLSVSDIKGTVNDYAELFEIPKIIAKKIRKPLEKRRIDEGIAAAIGENDGDETTMPEDDNDGTFHVNVRGKQGKLVTLRRVFSKESTIEDVALAYKDEECVDQHYKVEKIILTSDSVTLDHKKKLKDYNIINENNLISVIFKTKGGAEEKVQERADDRVIKFGKYGLKKTSLADCLIGYDDDDGFDRALLDCGKHAMTAETMYQYIASSLASNAKLKNIYCPIKGCKKKLDWTKCTQIADMNKYEYMKWTDILEQHRLGDMKQCPHCKAYCKRDDGVAIFRMRCIACNGSDWCWNCCQVWKGSGLSMCANQNCSIIRETNERISKSVKVKSTYGYDVPQFRACPRCLTFIEYSQACKHMICSGCDKQFCFICLGLQSSDGKWPCGSHKDHCKLAGDQKF